MHHLFDMPVCQHKVPVAMQAPDGISRCAAFCPVLPHGHVHVASSMLKRERERVCITPFHPAGLIQIITWQIPKDIGHREKHRTKDMDIHQVLKPILTLASSYQLQ